MIEPPYCRRTVGLALVVAGALALQDQFSPRGNSPESTAVPARDTSEGDERAEKVCTALPTDSGAGDGGASIAAAADPLSEEQLGRAWPHLLPLTHSKVPVVQNNRTVSHKSVYYGRISLGYPVPQEFKVVFDTGSAHAIVASVDCQEHACFMHQRYNSTMSATAVDINIDGSWVYHKNNRDTVTVGFGTGSVYADIVREILCVSSSYGNVGDHPRKICSATHMLVARQMSVLFETATFDGIVGLSFPKLALSHDFSFQSCLSRVMGSSAPSQFAFFLADDESGRGSELSLGGHNPSRLLSPLLWVPVSDPEEGHWKVAMSAVTVGNLSLDICEDGKCQGIVDTGTSHLGVPREDLRDLVDLLSRPASASTDCRRVEGQSVTIWLDGLNLTLSPWEYMRPLPLRAGTFLNKDHMDNWVVVPAMSPDGRVLDMPTNVTQELISFTCTPRLFPVVLKPGKKIFLLGEPVLQRYYSVFDWQEEAIGFGLADQRPQDNQAASNGFDDSTLLQLNVLPNDFGTRLERQFAVSAGEGLEDATSIGTELGLITAPGQSLPSILAGQKFNA